MKDFIIKEVELAEALKVHPKIEEWDRKEAGTVEYCRKKLENLKQLILGAYINNEIIGYLMAYEKKESFHCWITAVDKRYRRIGILTEMMIVFENFAKSNGFNKVTLKTLNNKREMLNYLAKSNWNFIDIIKKDNVYLNEIVAEKIIGEE